jgi:cytochrome P450
MIARKPQETKRLTALFSLLADSVCQETMRLSSGVFMVRYIQEDTKFTDSQGQEHLMRKGDRVAMYPPAIHKDPEIFEEPLVSIHSCRAPHFINE